MTSPWGGAGSLDEKMIADLREWRSRITPAPSEAERSAGHPYSVQLRLEEVDALLAAVDERDALKREACEMPDERAENVTPIRVVHSACGKPRPRRRTNCRRSVTPILLGYPAPDEVSIEITAEVPETLREPGLLPFCNCGSVDKNGDDIGEDGPRCPYHLAVLEHVAAKTPQPVLEDLCKRTLAAQARLA